MTDPADHLYLIEHQVWARVDADGLVTQGITALGVRLSGEVYMCRPKGVGVVVEQGKSMGVVELAKSIVSVKSPLGGEVVAVNPRLRDEPELVHRDPYGAGWLLRLRPSNLASETEALVTGDAIAPAMAAHARLFRIDE
ncbi:glycine cleavage system protein H [Hydrogenophaga flava]|uniref:glycine cleavage system protein H n=1 Tax=Hydrogenophaga flava TaxID=65657 RepID=UPI00082581D8|nr:glycine cleavage system protein H [Hydrogenophaga flava]